MFFGTFWEHHTCFYNYHVLIISYLCAILCYSEEIAPHIQGLPLVAHNSPFDESCLKAAFEAYDMEYPGYRFYCTCRASRKLLGDKLPNHQLQTVAAYCGYDLTKHHHAMADAEACAAIAMKLIDF